MEVIFERLSAHFIEGMMIHDQFANYYDFLGFRGYKRCHEYHFLSETMSYRKLNRYYINHHGKLIPEMEVDDPNVIPGSWIRYKREDVDTSTKRNAVETAIKRWVSWEKETKSMLEEGIKSLCEAGKMADAMFLKKFLKSVDCELKYAERKMIELQDVNYDIGFIMQEQECIHDKYIKKMGKLL